MSKEERDEATIRIHPFPTLIAQSLQLAAFAGDATPGTVQVLAKSALVFAAMSLECAATSCLELIKLPKAPHAKIDRTLSVIDKFDVLQWFAVRAPLDRGSNAVQKIDDLVSARNALVHARVRREPFGPIREYAAGEGVEVGSDSSAWNALHIPKDERSWDGTHARQAVTAAVGFLNHFFFEACRMEQQKVVQMLCTSSGEATFVTPWESEALSVAARRFELNLRFLGI